jgi:RNA recognition motif-containing protein
MDREAGRSKGFAFVEMNSYQEAKAAIAALKGRESNGRESNGRAFTVNEARPREERSAWPHQDGFWR